MTAQRSRKEEQIYKKYYKKLQAGPSANKCVFCSIKSNSDQIVEETKYFKIMYNIFPYSIWDSEPIISHLMIVPKMHTDKLGKLPAPAGKELLKLIDAYEDKGYNLYARAPGSKIKSITHQHSHLIKPGGKRKKFIFFTRIPYIRITF